MVYPLFLIHISNKNIKYSKHTNIHLISILIFTTFTEKKYLESCKDLAIEPAEALKGEIIFDFKIDAATFINYYSGIFTKAALSRITGINERQLWHYAAGVHKPRKQQLEKIQKGINALTKELSSISLL